MSHKLSLLKAITYRCIGTIATFIIALVFTGKIEISLPIAVVDAVSKITLYYLHERLYHRILVQNYEEKKN